ncbi:hypothetical protein PRIPAC_86827 [Pristionchus pacificus]|uniref:Uncharacterized protein n=1 Tax=Pristionchus pacificus TaxID=54126 RepID=A0A2A6BNG3_PRIPA|nr:hypothetical protein PRIPAC_86827 [Pristionchus pacificus]|eukprot:PDM67502.1 hypothetical protein PRIPAC_48919 [Pristionchus pacificus]
MSDVEMGGVNGEDPIPRTFTAEEEEELLAGDGLEKKVEESKKQMILTGAATGEKPVSTRNTRSKSKDLKDSTAPRDAVIRVNGKLDELREALRQREVSKGQSALSVTELETLFDRERAVINEDLKVIDGALIVSANFEAEYQQLEGHYNQKRNEFNELNDEMVEALVGTDFTRVEDLRFRYNEPNMADEWAVDEVNEAVDVAPAFELKSDLPEVKLFGKWSHQEAVLLLCTGAREVAFRNIKSAWPTS